MALIDSIEDEVAHAVLASGSPAMLLKPGLEQLFAVRVRLRIPIRDALGSPDEPVFDALRMRLPGTREVALRGEQPLWFNVHLRHYLWREGPPPPEPYSPKLEPLLSVSAGEIVLYTADGLLDFDETISGALALCGSTFGADARLIERAARLIERARRRCYHLAEQETRWLKKPNRK